MVANSAWIGAIAGRVLANSASIATLSACQVARAQMVGPDSVVMRSIAADMRKKAASLLLWGSTKADIGGSLAASGDTIQQNIGVDAALGLHACRDK